MLPYSLRPFCAWWLLLPSLDYTLSINLMNFYKKTLTLCSVAVVSVKHTGGHGWSEALDPRTASSTVAVYRTVVRSLETPCNYHDSRWHPTIDVRSASRNRRQLMSEPHYLYDRYFLRIRHWPSRGTYSGDASCPPKSVLTTVVRCNGCCRSDGSS